MSTGWAVIIYYIGFVWNEVSQFIVLWKWWENMGQNVLSVLQMFLFCLLLLMVTVCFYQSWSADLSLFFALAAGTWARTACQQAASSWTSVLLRDLLARPLHHSQRTNSILQHPVFMWVQLHRRRRSIRYVVCNIRATESWLQYQIQTLAVQSSS